MRNVRIQIAYDGSRFFGWQRQEGFPTVQEAVEEAIEALVGDAVRIRGAGRTDTGVHALGQVAHFHVDTPLGDDRLCHALNAHLPPGVSIPRLETCRDDFHAQYDSRGKRYMYLTLTQRFRPPFGLEHAHWVRDPLDLAAMRRAARRLVGERDFLAFANAGSPRRTSVRELRSLHVIARRRSFAIVLEGSGFLYRMARVIVGTLLEVGRGKRRPEELDELLESKDRTLAGATAPAQGLYLVSVRYAEPVFPGRRRGPRGAPGVFP